MAKTRANSAPRAARDGLRPQPSRRTPKAKAKARPPAARKAAATKAKPAAATSKAKLAAARKGAASQAKPPKKPKLVAPGQVLPMYQLLRERHPDAHCELEHTNPFQLIVATVLSAQSTDVMVNKITPGLFARFPDAAALAAAAPSEVEAALSRIGMYRQKAKNIVGLAKRLVAEHGGEVPRSLAQLVELPGVGRKTANVVLGVAFNASEGVVVDTHVQRISQRLGWTKHDDPINIEQDLMRLFPRSEWDRISHTLIFHGRRVCTAQRPACAACPLGETCPSAFHAEQVGRKPLRQRG